MRCILALGAAAALAQSASADIVFSDTEFATGNWGTDLVNIGGAGSMVASQVSGGNPGFCRRVDQTPGPNSGDAIYALHRFGTTMATRYDPATQGAIVSLSFLIDYVEEVGAGATTHQILYVAAKQGQTVFIGPGIDTHGALVNFQTLTANALTATNFTAVGGSGTLDLSSAGQPIRFGFATAVTNSTGAFPSRCEYDNWSVHIVQAPAPGAAVVLEIGREHV